MFNKILVEAQRFVIIDARNKDTNEVFAHLMIDAPNIDYIVDFTSWVDSIFLVITE